jgi:hypothetical protein
MADVATPQEYKIVITGEDGSGDQVFTASSPEELNQKLKTAQENASRKIREQAAELKELRESAATPAPTVTVNTSGDNYDHSVYLTLLQQDGRKAHAYAAKFPESWPAEVREDYQQVREASLHSRRQSVNAEFAREHPELLQVTPEQDVKNSQAISKILVELYPELASNNGVYTKKQLEAAYNQARAEKLLSIPADTATPVVTTTDTVTVPSVISTSTGTAPAAPTDEDFKKWAMDPNTKPHELRAELERRAAARAQAAR